jgi:hypothetical protein
MKEVRLDIDQKSLFLEDKLEMFCTFPKPFYIRRSANDNFHVKFTCPAVDCENDCYDCFFYEFDDPRRLKLNKERKAKGMSHNVLWDRKDGKKAGKWKRITNFEEFAAFTE